VPLEVILRRESLLRLETVEQEIVLYVLRSAAAWEKFPRSLITKFFLIPRRVLVRWSSS
jgi:hypothetical protein